MWEAGVPAGRVPPARVPAAAGRVPLAAGRVPDEGRTPAPRVAGRLTPSLLPCARTALPRTASPRLRVLGALPRLTLPDERPGALNEPLLRLELALLRLGALWELLRLGELNELLLRLGELLNELPRLLEEAEPEERLTDDELWLPPPPPRVPPPPRWASAGVKLRVNPTIAMAINFVVFISLLLSLLVCLHFCFLLQKYNHYSRKFPPRQHIFPPGAGNKRSEGCVTGACHTQNITPTGWSMGRSATA